jgi:circadian clock protein KaiC
MDFTSQPVPSGIAELDALLGGGVDRGTSMLLLGAAGTGKSSIAMQFVHTALARGDRAAMFLFDENLHTMLLRGESIGIDLRDGIKRERVTVRQVDPAEMPPGEFVSLVRAAVEASDARIVVIDSLNGYTNAMTEERYLTVHMHELLSYLNLRGVLTIVVMAQHGLMGRMESPIDVSYLSDVVVLLRYFESSGGIRQAISVMKKRTGRHERTIREFQITSAGIRVGPPLVEFQGVLTGVPTYVGQSAPLMEGKRGI